MSCWTDSLVGLGRPGPFLYAFPVESLLTYLLPEGRGSELGVMIFITVEASGGGRGVVSPWWGGAAARLGSAEDRIKN